MVGRVGIILPGQMKTGMWINSVSVSRASTISYSKKIPGLRKVCVDKRQKTRSHTAPDGLMVPVGRSGMRKSRGANIYIFWAEKNGNRSQEIHAFKREYIHC